MSDFKKSVINVRATSKRNGISSLVIGVCLLFASGLWLALVPRSLNIPGFFLASAGIVTMLIGWFKIREPNHSINMTPANITYRHRLGQWQLDWDDIQGFGQPNVTRGVEQKPLTVVGFKTKNYEAFISSISPRLATHILMEQRPLLLQNTEKACTSGSCGGGDIINDTKYKLPSGKVLTGVQAMLANRMAQLRDMLGFDIYIAASELDRDPHDFVVFLKNCQQTRVTSHEDTRP